MNRSARSSHDFALATRAREPGFTPSARDAPALFALAAGDDEQAARDAARALSRLEGALVAAAARELAGDDAARRAIACRLLGKRAPADDAATRLLLGALGDGEERVRRAAASALGRIRGRADVAQALAAAWRRDERGASPATRRAFIEALGKAGGAEAVAILASAAETKTGGDASLDRVLSRARVRATRTEQRSAPSSIDASRAPDAPVTLIFRCREGLEPLLADELGAVPGLARAATSEPGAVRAELTGPLSRAFGARTALSFAIALRDEPRSPGDDLAGRVARALTSPAARAAFARWTRGAARYRIAWVDGGHRRALVWSIAERVAEAAPDLVNDPTASAWEARVRERDGAVSVELVPRALDDPRFAYRVRDVPAASHPTVAAALARVAGVRDDDVVWDPFVGSATDLIERARLGPFAALLGSDVDARALAAARENLAEARVDADLERGDALELTPRGVTLILTNPPMGRRVLHHGAIPPLLERFVAHASRVLVPGGRLVWVSPVPEATRAAAAAHRLDVELSMEIDMGGFLASVQVLRSRRR